MTKVFFCHLYVSFKMAAQMLIAAVFGGLKQEWLQEPLLLNARKRFHSQTARFAILNTHCYEIISVSQNRQ